MVSNYETGRSEISDERAEQLAEVLGMDIIDVRRNLGLWVPDDQADDDDQDEDADLIALIRYLGPEERDALRTLLGHRRVANE